jgi:DNA-binding CsgD family transcriptional regulator
LFFSYYLHEFSESWSQWTTETYKDFSNLEEGTYLFKVKAKNVFEVESEVSTVQFVISPPWHRSKWAYFLYIVTLIIFIYLGAKFIQYRIKLANGREKLRHQLELQKKEAEFNQQALRAEKEIIKLRNDKLRAEKIHRDKELANQTMTVIQKNKLLLNLNGELKRIHNLTTDSSLITRLVLMKKRINRELEDKRQNKLFETYFEDVHADFFKRLKERYPQLSPNDLNLCAYIRMNISTKETAALLNISYKGVEIRRYRLRKKINISRETNLSTFLSNV